MFWVKVSDSDQQLVWRQMKTKAWARSLRFLIKSATSCRNKKCLYVSDNEKKEKFSEMIFVNR